MNLFSLVIKQMRQRALSTWLTLLSVVLGVALAITVLILYNQAGRLFGQTSFGFEAIVGKPGSATQLVMNTVYHVDKSPGNIPYSVYESFLKPPQVPGQKVSHSILGSRPAPTTTPVNTAVSDAPMNFYNMVKVAVPYVVGDSYNGVNRIIGTTTNLFGIDNQTGAILDPEHTLPYKPEGDDGPAEFYQFSQGHCFAPNRFEAVVGANVAKERNGLRVGSEFQATHGELVVPNPDIHPEKWKVTGVLKPTGTASDNCVFIPILSVYTIGEHEKGLKAQWILQHGGQAPKDDEDPDNVHAYKINPDGTFDLYVPKDVWEVSAILVKTRVIPDAFMYAINNRHDAMAVSPAQTMQQFFDEFLKPSTILLLVIAVMVSIVAAIGILVSIYNSVSARGREIAIIRALGATRAKVMGLICIEAGFIGLAGSLSGLLCGHLAAAVASAFFQKYLGTSINWHQTTLLELYYVLGITLVTVLAGFVPATKAYRSPVATNLVAG